MMNLRLSLITLAAFTSTTFGSVVPANAQTTFDIIWSSTTGSGTTGTSNIVAAPGDRLVAQVVLDPDPVGGVSAYAISLEFDSDLADELDLVSVSVSDLPTSFFGIGLSPGSTQESDGGQVGNILTLAAGTYLFFFFPLPSPFVIAEVTFDVTGNVSTDGSDVFSGAFDVRMDGVGDEDSNDVTASVVFGSASVDSPVGVPGLALPASAGLAIALAFAAVARVRRMAASEQ